MANKTIDRRKAGMTRSRAGLPSQKAANTKAARPAVSKEVEEARLKASTAEVLDTDETEAEDMVEENPEESAQEEEADEATEEEAEEQPSPRRSKRERGLTTVQPDEFAIAKRGGPATPRNAFVRYILSAYRELFLVTWPTWQDTRNWSIVVIIVAGGIGVLLGAFDLGLAKVVTWWLSLAKK